LSFERVPDQEPSAMHLPFLELFRMPALDAESLRGVVTIVALRLGVARLAQAPIFGRHLSMVTHEARIVAEKGLRRRPRQILRLVTGRALPLLPLLSVLVTGEALAHRRQRRGPALHHSAVTGHALPLDFAHGEVLIVIESDRAAARARPCDQRAHPAGILVMARAAPGGVAARRTRPALRAFMTAVAAEARRSAWRSARQPNQVREVRKARLDPRRAGSQNRGREQRQKHSQSKRRRFSRPVHRGTPGRERSNVYETRNSVCASRFA
jgi:hypothetical protein